jgi:Zn-dependent peptidase ImmA (M78 family)
MERLALTVLVRNGVHAPPVDVDLIAEREGLRFERTSLYGDVSGAYYRGQGRSGHAFISAAEHPLRQVFTKAHELCHHILDEPAISVAAGYPNLQLPSGYRGRESHALHDRFAAALLMPAPWIGNFIRERGWKLERAELIPTVARNFGVSQRAAEVRLEILGHLQRSPR